MLTAPTSHSPLVPTFFVSTLFENEPTVFEAAVKINPTRTEIDAYRNDLESSFRSRLAATVLLELATRVRYHKTTLNYGHFITNYLRHYLHGLQLKKSIFSLDY